MEVALLGLDLQEPAVELDRPLSFVGLYSPGNQNDTIRPVLSSVGQLSGKNGVQVKEIGALGDFQYGERDPRVSFKLAEGALRRGRIRRSVGDRAFAPNQAPAKDSYTPFAQLGSLAFFKRMVSEPSGFVFC